MIDPNDFEDSQEYLDSIYYGVNNSEVTQGPVEYLSPHIPRQSLRPWDSGKWYDEDPDELAKILVTPVTEPLTVEFNFKQHISDSKQTSRNRLMFGSIQTPSEKIQLWGFLSWLEFQDHIADNQPLAKRVREELQANTALMYHQVGQVKFSFWLAKNYQAQTRPGYWAIVIEESNQRTVVHSVNGHLHFNEGLTVITKNQVTINKEK